MDDWGGIAARFAVYVTLVPAFGVPLQSLLDGRSIRRRWLLTMVAAAFVASIVALLALIAAMAGAPILPVDRETLRMVVAETPIGIAFVTRFAALAVAAAASCRGDRGGAMIVCAASGVALATVAWTGHGAMQEGAAGMVHLVADILHMLAGAAWIGAILALRSRLFPSRGAAPDLVAAHAALRGFAVAGSVMVVTVLITGVVNSWMIIGADGISTVRFVPYGQMLLAKLALFGAMLAIAAYHRQIAVPRLHDAIRHGDPDAATRSLRRSLALEMIAGVAILGVVARLGTLSPTS